MSQGSSDGRELNRRFFKYSRCSSAHLTGLLLELEHLLDVCKHRDEIETTAG